MKKKHNIKSKNIHKCYYFDDIMKLIDIDFSNIMLNEKSYKTYKNILKYCAY